MAELEEYENKLVIKWLCTVSLIFITVCLTVLAVLFN